MVQFLIAAMFCDFSAEEFERLSNYFVFEDVSDNENETPAVNVEVEHATEKPVEASASADNLPVDQGHSRDGRAKVRYAQ